MVMFFAAYFWRRTGRPQRASLRDELLPRSNALSCNETAVDQTIETEVESVLS